MKLEEIADSVKYKKSGFIPYFLRDDGPPVFMFMTPSDHRFGGPQPAIAKGGIDDKETTKQAAVREAGEELGLRPSNLITETVSKVWEGNVRGKKNTYHLTVYAGQVKSQTDFGPHDAETGAVHWLTADEFLKEGRQSHVPVFKAVLKALKGLGDKNDEPKREEA